MSFSKVNSQQHDHDNDWHEAHTQLQRVQKKSLDISNPGDSDETEADEVARKVMQNEPASIQTASSGVNRKGDGNAEASAEFQSQLESKKGNGAALDSDVRSEMESKMGADFSNVKIHTGSDAGSMSDSINAKAFTHGQDVFFNQGQYNPSSSAGKELLAHELVHTVQQGKDSVRPKINRRIMIAGKPYTPSAANTDTPEETEDYEKYDPVLLDKLHNDGKEPDYNFETHEEFDHNMKMRTSAMYTIWETTDPNHDSVNFGYRPPINERRFSLPDTWIPVTRKEFHMQTEEVAGTPNSPSRAVRSIFENHNSETWLDCNLMIIAIQYKAMLDAYGDEKFDQMFPGGKNLIIGPTAQGDLPETPDKEGYQTTDSGKHPLNDGGLYDAIDVAEGEDALSKLIPGDWVYFKNAPEYITFVDNYHKAMKESTLDPGRYPEYRHYDAWQGEHAIYLGERGFKKKKEGSDEEETIKLPSFTGFGLDSYYSYDDMLGSLLYECKYEYKSWQEALKNKFYHPNQLNASDVPDSVISGKPRIERIYKMNSAKIEDLSK